MNAQPLILLDGAPITEVQFVKLLLEEMETAPCAKPAQRASTFAALPHHPPAPS